MMLRRESAALFLAVIMAACSDRDVDPVPDPVPVDADADGFTSDEDCDDDNATVYPEAEEVCDLEDNDCDGIVDEGWPMGSWFPDEDGDGYPSYYDPRTVFQGCMAPEGYTGTQILDCDDSDLTVYTGAPEICDGKDNDCDLPVEVDEGCV